jgi:hypothetical protein
VSNDEVERRALTENKGSLFQSPDFLLHSSKLRHVAPTDC